LEAELGGNYSEEYNEKAKVIKIRGIIEGIPV